MNAPQHPLGGSVGPAGSVLAAEAAANVSGAAAAVGDTVAVSGTPPDDECEPDNQLPQDSNVNPNPPKELPTERSVGGSATQNQFVQNLIRSLRKQKAEDIRVNQQQVNGDGVRVGINRPDLQYTLVSALRKLGQ